jgi:alpha-L-arabinofuranosidase
MINVLQSVILTEGDKMLLTPTYHVFDLFKRHQGATLVDSWMETEPVADETEALPNLSESASIGADGALTVTIANLSASSAYPVQCGLVGKQWKNVSARILTGKMDAKNDFQRPDAVHPQKFSEITVGKDEVSFTIPPCSVLELVADQK